MTSIVTGSASACGATNGRSIKNNPVPSTRLEAASGSIAASSSQPEALRACAKAKTKAASTTSKAEARATETERSAAGQTPKGSASKPGRPFAATASSGSAKNSTTIRISSASPRRRHPCGAGRSRLRPRPAPKLGGRVKRLASSVPTAQISSCTKAKSAARPRSNSNRSA